jgi:hypothetical protein
MNRDLNSEAREKLELLLSTEPNSLTQADIEFLRARSSYLSDAQKDMLAKFDTAKKAKAKDDEELKK